MTDPFAALRLDHPTRFATPDRIAELAGERFRPWPLQQLATGGTPLKAHSTMGFVRDSRFGSGQVIPGTNRAKQRSERQKAESVRK